MRRFMKKEKSNKHANGAILSVVYVMIIIFLLLVGYFIYFIQIQSESIINHSYNTRLDNFSERIVRGEILSNDKRVLAHTMVGDDRVEVRKYPYGSLFSHVVGYTEHGKTGLELQGNYYLLSSHINIIEKTINEISGIKNIGDNIVTTLDIELQELALQSLGNNKGSIIVMEPSTGKILALASTPNFDPNRIYQDWEGLTSEENEQAQLLNRATQGIYPPGSVFKIITAYGYMEQNPNTWKQFQYVCDGHYEVGSDTISCFQNTAHGTQDLKQAFANSCNGAFSQIGYEMSNKQLEELATEFLFDQSLPLEMEYKKSSFVMEDTAGDWDRMQAAIGQGLTQMTPMHMNLITATIANGGIMMEPYLIDHVENGVGQEVKHFLPNSNEIILDRNILDDISEFMVEVVQTGTGSALKNDRYSVAGKTGSAEFEEGKESHAWFSGYAPVENPQIVITVLVEEGGSGGGVAAPIARAMFDAYLLGENSE